MKKTKYLMTVAFVLLAISACNISTAPKIQTAVAATIESRPTPTTQALPPTSEAQPTSQSIATGQSFAQACPAAPTCSAPVVKDTDVFDSFCVKKRPYQNIPIPLGTTFEILDPTGVLYCVDSGAVVDGMKIISCTGSRLRSYKLKITNPACSANPLTLDPIQCQEGFGLDIAQNCCAPLNAENPSAIIKVNLGTCK